MNLWTMIFLIVTIVMIAEVIKTLARSGSKRPADEGRLARLEDRLTAVERRLENLETITTSKDFQLDREFEALSRQREQAR